MLVAKTTRCESVKGCCLRSVRESGCSILASVSKVSRTRNAGRKAWSWYHKRCTHQRGRETDENRYCLGRPLQTTKMWPGVQTLLPGESDRKALHRGDSDFNNSFHLGVALHWMWDLRSQVPVWGDSDHQPSNGPGVTDNASLLGELVQTAPLADASARSGSGLGGR
jgi:hypothetical protein